MYNLEFLKSRGFFRFSNSETLKKVSLEIIVDPYNQLAFLDLKENELEPEKVSEIIKEVKQKIPEIKYIWINQANKIRIYNNTPLGNIKWFYYSYLDNTRPDVKKSKEDKLNRLKPDAIIDVFDTRDIAEKFYIELWKYRINAAKGIKGPTDDKNKLLVVQRFIDRLIFFYFLLEANFVRVKFGNEEGYHGLGAARKIMGWLNEKIEDTQLFMLLNSVFFDILGSYNERGYVEKSFSISTKHNKKVEISFYAPYLDGGLFANERIEGKEEKDIVINGVDKLIKIFNEYNWIIGEELPEESSEIIGELTPEIIGHIYEKFVVSLEQMNLGKINLNDLNLLREEIKYKRKKVGAYYTPDTITNYISENAIKPLIKGKIVDKFGEKYEELVDRIFSDDKNITNNKEEIQVIKYIYFNILKKIKVCDNACGSGSFLLAAGKILLDLDIKIMNILEDNLNSDQEFKIELNKIQDSINKNYYFTRYIITNNLYGVDIMDGAIEIAKLKLWLWLISEVNPSKIEERKIETLPNLDFNLLIGNSLIGFADVENIKFSFLKQRSLKTHLSDDKIKWLKDIVKRKQELKTAPLDVIMSSKKELDNELREAREYLNDEFYNFLLSNNISISKAELINLKPFHLGLEFPEVFDLEKPIEERGFDIIIGNPPYGNTLSKFEKIILPLYIKVIISDGNIRGTNNAAATFIERSNKLLIKNGKFGYIVPKALLYIKEWQKTRKFLLEEVSLIRVVDCGKAFRGVKLEMCIIIYENQNTLLSDKVITHNLYIGRFKRYSTKPYFISRAFLTTERFITEMDKEKESIYNSIIGKSVPLGELSEIKRGLSINKYVSNLKSVNYIKILRGDDIDRYTIVKFGFIHKKHIEAQNDFIPGDIIFQRIVAHLYEPYPHIKLTGTLNIKKVINVNTITNISVKEKYKGDLSEKFLLLLLDSNLLSWFSYKFIYINAIRSMDFVGTYAYKVPIIRPDFIRNIQEPFITVANYMLFLNLNDKVRKKEKELINFVDRQIIDSLVYELYFKEKFERDEIKTNLLQLLEPHLKDIKKAKSDEEKLKIIKQVVESIQIDREVMDAIKKIKGHKWVKIIEGKVENFDNK